MNTTIPALRVFSARACAAPLEEAAVLFERKTGIHVQIDVCSRHCAVPVAEEATGTTGGDDFLLEIAEAGVHDLAIGGAEYLLDEGEVRGLVLRGERRTIACRVSTLIVPADNPRNIAELGDLTRPGVRIGISTIDCLKGLWEDICGRAGLIAAVRPNIVYHANGCIAIVEAVAEKKVDVAFGWNTFEELAAGRIRSIELPAELRIKRGTGIGLLRFAKSPEQARQFMDFLVTREARACYKAHGWELF